MKQCQGQCPILSAIASLPKVPRPQPKTSTAKFLASFLFTNNNAKLTPQICHDTWHFKNSLKVLYDARYAIHVFFPYLVTCAIAYSLTTPLQFTPIWQPTRRQFFDCTFHRATHLVCSLRSEFNNRATLLCSTIIADVFRIALGNIIIVNGAIKQKTIGKVLN